MSGLALKSLSEEIGNETALAKVMTQAFIGDFARISSVRYSPAQLVKGNKSWDEIARGNTDLNIFLELDKDYEDKWFKVYQGQGLGKKIDMFPVMRTLIAGLCHSFNNLLMGIQCNAGLIRYNFQLKIESRKNIQLIETHVQAGAFVTNLLLAYLGERRHSAQKLRRRQLVEEILKSVSNEKRTAVARVLYEQLVWAARVKSPQMVAGATARLINTLMKEIDRLLEGIKSSQPGNISKLKKMGKLVQRGNNLAWKLKLYSGDVQLKPETVDLGIVLGKEIDKARKSKPDIKIEFRTGRHTKAVTDAGLIIIILEELLSNAFQVSETGSKVEVEIVSYEEQVPWKRFGSIGSAKSLVMVVRDYGTGMSRCCQEHAFDPFFTSKGIRRGKGLGLSVAASLAHCLGGYLHLQSRPGWGTRVSLHLPIDG